MVEEPDEKLRAAVKHLLSLTHGDNGVLEMIVYGARALPVLRSLLFQREPSGLFQPRCRVVEAIASLGGDDILVEFLGKPQQPLDPVELSGETAVMNAAARAFVGRADEQILQLLLRLVKERHLSGAIEVLGRARLVDALPSIVSALTDDIARPAAEAALLKYDGLAVPFLLEVLRRHEEESESSLRKRRSALRLLLQIGAASRIPPGLRWDLINERDPNLSLLGCRIAIAYGSGIERSAVIAQLIARLCSAPWLMRNKIEDLLVSSGRLCGPAVDQAIINLGPKAEDDLSFEAEVARTLHRVRWRLRDRTNPSKR